jgi:hypothetical protein
MQQKQVSIATVLSQVLVNVAFWCALTGNKWNRWLHLLSRLMNVQLSNQADALVPKLTTSGPIFITQFFFAQIDLKNQITPKGKNFYLVLTSQSFSH